MVVRSGDRAGIEKGEDAAAKFCGLVAESGRVESAGNFPELFGAAGGGVNPFGVAAGKRFISLVADEEHGKGALSNGFFRRDKIFAVSRRL